MQLNWNERQHKNEIARPFVWNSKPYFSSVLTLPSAHCGDLKYAMSTGAIDSSTNVLAVERDKDAFARMKRVISDLPLHPVCMNEDLAAVQKFPFAFDLVNLDYVGNMRKVDVVGFVQNIRPLLLPGANVFITFSNATRGNLFCKTLLDELKIHVPLYLIGVADQYGKRSEIAAMYYLLTFLYLLDGYSWEGQLRMYQDGTPMLIWGLLNIQKTQKELTDHYTNKISSIIQNVIDRLPNECESKTIQPGVRHKTISRQLAYAQTSHEIKAVERKMQHYAALQSALGKNPIQVIAGFRAAATKIKKLHLDG